MHLISLLTREEKAKKVPKIRLAPVSGMLKFCFISISPEG